MGLGPACHRQAVEFNHYLDTIRGDFALRHLVPRI
jgi:hypothetical protein